MITRESLAAAMLQEPTIEQSRVSVILDDLEGCEETPSQDRDVIAHVLWRQDVTPDHPGECRADEEHSIYENECRPCQTLLLGIADRILSRAAAVGAEQGSTDQSIGGRDE